MLRFFFPVADQWQLAALPTKAGILIHREQPEDGFAYAHWIFAAKVEQILTGRWHNQKRD
jgi:hypothetical protein